MLHQLLNLPVDFINRQNRESGWCKGRVTKTNKTFEKRKEKFIERVVKEEKVFGTKGRFISSNSVTRAGPYASRNLATEPLESSSPEKNGPTLHLAFNRETDMQ
ncbi:hypothetical protein L2E82_25106 [Cichorium intybus]|uniref:Uncharacterized protein n=1 Tax=Cichorium intybus TaxID=13427 RepID=A0ACB9E2R6_CICIN|nr:hypothetical protein L2E82_25106 [Cichorium intybus]